MFAAWGSSSCWTVRAPKITDVTAGFVNNHASAR